MPSSVAIRLAVEGGAEVKRAFDEAGRAGQSAFQGVGAAADQAAAAVDRQTAKYQRLAQAAREAEAQARAQANINSLLGVGQGSSGAARDSASAFEEALARQDQIQAARQAQAAQSAQANLNQLLGIRDSQIGAARASASAFEEVYRQEAEALKRTADLRAAAVRNASSGWRDLGSAGAAALANIEASRRLGSLGMGPQAANENTRLRPDQVQNLLYQGGDVLSQLGSGSPLGMIAFQQGPQIAQTFAGPGGASLKSAFAQAGEAASSLVSRISPVGAAIGAVGAVVLTGAAAWASYRGSQKEVEQQLTGIGRASNTSVSQINAVALAASASAGVSVSTARDMAGQFAATGRIGSEMYAGLIGVSRDYALTTRQELPDATKTLADAFADPVKGAETLNAQLGFLDATTKETIERLAQSGDRLGAQKALFDAIGASVAGARDKLGFFTRQWEDFKRTTSDEFDGVGRFIDRGLGGGDAETRLRALQGQLDFRQRNMGRAGGVFDGLLGFDVDTIKKHIAEVQAEIDKASRANRTSEMSQRGLEVDAIVKRLSPSTEALDQLERKAALIKKYLDEGGIDKDGASRRALDGLTAQARQLKEDMAAGGAAYADALRSARNQNALVGAAPFGRDAASINEAQDNKRLQALRDAAGDATSDKYTKAVASIEEERKILLDTLNRTQTQSQVQRGGAFARAPADIQQMILAATQRYPTVPPEVLAALGEKENGFRLSGPTRVLNAQGQPATTAWGYGQITVDAETDVRKLIPGFDRKDPNTAVEGAAAYLSQRLKWVNGDMVKALDGYGTGPGYGVDVLRRAGQLGDQSSVGIARDLDTNARAIRSQQQELKNANDNYGVNGRALAENTRVNQLLAQAQAEGRDQVEGYTQSLVKMGRESVSAERALANVRIGRDLAFDRDQLGRDRLDQGAYSRARSLYGDTTSGDAQAFIAQSRQISALGETKNTFSDVFGTLVSDLRRGADAATVASDALGRFADKLISNVIDKVTSGLFSGIASSATGGAGFLKLLGFDGGGYTGAGGRTQPVGVVHGHEFVFDQAAVNRYGVGTLEAMRRGVPGFADGGYTMPSAAAMRSANANAPQVVFAPNIIPPAGYEARTREVDDGRGGRKPEITFAEITAQGIRSPQGQAALQQQRVARR